MAGTTLAQFGPLLKQKYEPGILTMLNNNVAAFDDFDDEVLAYDGLFAIMGLKKGRNQSVQSAAEGQILNPPGAGQYARLTVQAKLVYGSIQITGPTAAAAATTSGGLAPVLMTEMDGMVEDITKRMNVFTFCGGDIPGVVWQKQNAAAFQYSGRFDDVSQEDSGVTLVPGVSTGRLIRLDNYDFVGAATVITSISGDSESPAIGTITFAAAIDTTAVPVGVPMAVQLALTPSVAVDPSGFLRNLCSQTHYGAENDRTTAGIAVSASNRKFRSTFRLADPTVASLSTLGADGLQQGIAQAQVKSGKTPTDIWCNPLQLTSYTTLLQGTNAGNIRIETGKGAQGKMDIAPDMEIGSAGRTQYSYGGVAMRVSDSCPNGTMFFINKSTWKRPELKKGEWQNISKAGELLQLPNMDAETARWGTYYEMVCKQPNANLVLTAIDLV